MNTFEIHECRNPAQPLGLGSSDGLGPRLAALYGVDIRKPDAVFGDMPQYREQPTDE